MITADRTPLKAVVGINERSLPDTTPEDREFRYLEISAVGQGVLRSPPETVRFGDAPSRARRLVEAGDTIISTVRTYLRAVYGISEEDDPDTLVVSTGFAVLTPGPAVNPRYFSWMAQSDPFIEEVVARSVGVSYPAINPSELGRLQVPLPPLDVQTAIADFLDAETARIDALITKKRRLVELLDERYRSVVDEVSATGRPRRVRHLTSLVTSGPRGWAARVGEEGHPFIRSANLRRDSVDLRRENLLRVDAVPTAEARRSRVRAGDTVVGITGANTGWVGLVTPGDAPAYVSQHVAILRPEGVDPAWLALSVFSRRAQEALLAGQYGGTKQQLGLADLADLVITVPSLEEQRRLVTRLAQIRELGAASRAKVRRQVDLLLEHRQALVTAAVTGELAVPGAA